MSVDPLTPSIVQIFTGVSLFLAWETPSSGFCCQLAYDISTNSCRAETHGTSEPFSLDAGTAIYNRTDGSTMLPLNLIASASTVTIGSTTATVTVTTSVGTNHRGITTVATSIAVPLGVLLLLAIIAIIITYRKYVAMRRRNVELMRSSTQTPSSVNMLQGYPAPQPYNSIPQELGVSERRQ